MRAYTIHIVIALLILAACCSTASAQAESGCVTDKCHTAMGTKEFVHGPVGAGICTICHGPVEGKDHEFNLVAEKEELCLGCHETSRDMLLEDHVHSPVADGNCVGCHDPHQSDFRYTLKGAAADLCFQCHQKDKFQREFIHGPVAGGDCNVCHNPHASANVNQLEEPPDRICLSCHAEKVETLAKRHVHPPVEESCTNCHDPHSDTARYLLNMSVPRLCDGCHDPVLGQEYPHDPVESGNCRTCHDVHASDHPRMFTIEPENLCFSCHEELGTYVAAQEHKHGPVEQGDCNACHDPHGSANFRMLRKYFPEEFYMPYETDNYAMCFECHNQNVAMDSETQTLTDFRDGSQNLHYLHVNKEVKGRSCKSCHEAHATDQFKHIRRSVPYGSMNWDLPIEFTKYDDGGSCKVGCHAVKEYHR